MSKLRSVLGALVATLAIQGVMTDEAYGITLGDTNVYGEYTPPDTPTGGDYYPGGWDNNDTYGDYNDSGSSAGGAPIVLTDNTRYRAIAQGVSCSSSMAQREAVAHLGLDITRTETGRSFQVGDRVRVRYYNTDETLGDVEIFEITRLNANTQPDFRSISCG